MLKIIESLIFGDKLERISLLERDVSFLNNDMFFFFKETKETNEQMISYLVKEINDIGAKTTHLQLVYATIKEHKLEKVCAITDDRRVVYPKPAKIQKWIDGYLQEISSLKQKRFELEGQLNKYTDRQKAIELVYNSYKKKDDPSISCATKKVVLCI